MNSDLSGVKVGDWIWTIRAGWVKVACICKSDCPVKTADGYVYTCNGRYLLVLKYPSAFVSPPACFNPGPKPCEFKKGQRVMVRDNDDAEWERMYFCCATNKLHPYRCYDEGMTEWSSEGEATGWKQCRAATEEDEL